MPSEQASLKAGVSKSDRPKRPKLTKAQLERKRQCDREAQRQIRLKTKNHIAHLEGLVKSLQEAHADNGRVTDLVEQLKTNQTEINRLREIIRGVTKLVESAGQPPNGLIEDWMADCGSNPDIDPKPQESRLLSTGPEDPLLDPLAIALGVPEPQVVGPSSLENFQLDRLGSLGSGSSRRSSLETSAEILQQEIYPPMIPDEENTINPAISANSSGSLPLVNPNPEQLAITHKINTIAKQIIQDRTLDGRLWYLAGSLLSFILNMPQRYQTPMEFEEDIPVRAVLHGWPRVAQRYYLDPGWLWLRHLDEALYSALGIPERLAIMRMMRMQYQAQVRPYLTAELPLPGFMEPRPAQKFMDHDPLVEHFVWPGMREQ